MLRVAGAVSQDEFAPSADVERAYVGHLERVTRNPTVAPLEKPAAALRCEMIELFRLPAQGDALPEPMKPGRRKK